MAEEWPMGFGSLAGPPASRRKEANPPERLPRQLRPAPTPARPLLGSSRRSPMNSCALHLAHPPNEALPRRRRMRLRPLPGAWRRAQRSAITAARPSGPPAGPLPSTLTTAPNRIIRPMTLAITNLLDRFISGSPSSSPLP
jgi:hypothetical protein